MARAILYLGFCVFLCTLWMQRSMCTATFIAARQSHQEIESYWTKERIAAAKPVVAPNSTAGNTPEWDVDFPASVARTVTTSIDGQSPKDIKGLIKSKVDSAPSTLGRLFFSIGNGSYVCSANVVASQNGDVIATARHCGFGNGGENYRFAPGYDRGNAPHGWWTWRRAGWVTTSGGSGDTAFVVLNTQNGQHVQNVVGSTGLVFGRTDFGSINLWGIPDDKNYAFKCQGQAGFTDNGTVITMANCNGMSGGAGGGAFSYIENGVSYQFATYFGSCGDKACGPIFGSAALEVYNGAKNA